MPRSLSPFVCRLRSVFQAVGSCGRLLGGGWTGGCFCVAAAAALVRGFQGSYGCLGTKTCPRSRRPRRPRRPRCAARAATRAWLGRVGAGERRDARVPAWEFGPQLGPEVTHDRPFNLLAKGAIDGGLTTGAGFLGAGGELRLQTRQLRGRHRGAAALRR